MVKQILNIAKHPWICVILFSCVCDLPSSVEAKYEKGLSTTYHCVQSNK